jgi:hypothetical protein
MCPDLKVSYSLDKGDQRHDSLTKSIAADNRIWKPQADDFVVDAASAAKPAKEPDSPVAIVVAPAEPGKSARVDSAQRQPGTATVKTDSVAAGVTKTDSVGAVASRTDSMGTATGKAGNAGSVAEAQAQSVAVAEKEDAKKIAESFTRRAPVLNKVLEVESDSVRLSFYDNGEIDGDSISVFVNSHLVLKHQELAAKAFNLFLRLDSSLDVNEISMFAENLGKYPPNTALMVVTDGKNRYEVFMSSSLTENATIRLRRKNRP